MLLQAAINGLLHSFVSNEIFTETGMQLSLSQLIEPRPFYFWVLLETICLNMRHTFVSDALL